MGKDCTALLKCPPFTDINDPRILSLEAGSPLAMQEVAAIDATGAPSKFYLNRPGWVVPHEWDSIKRPMSINSRAAFRTAELFELLFKQDGIRILHPLRWKFFLGDMNWQEPLLAAFRACADLMQATRGIVTSDDSEVIRAFEEGKCFDEALAMAPKTIGEISSLEDLYFEGDPDRLLRYSEGYWSFL